jgi:DNA gyrase subunit A
MNTIDICEELHQNFIDFAYEANSERAFPDVRDGLKPGQRACLWEMYTKGYTSNKPHVKSAKISGGTVASWWPHGDVAIYETFARMSQPWINNIPEVDWHGNNGNIVIGSVPAAARYTEARLSKATEEGMLQGLKKKNVPMIMNFSEDEEWPSVFPAVLPRLLINGSQGIGVTIANTWLPMNFKEVGEIIKNYLKTGEVDDSQCLFDFPSGGIIINKNNLPTIHKTGKGKIILRGKAEIKGNIISITELPYQVYIEPWLETVKELILKDDLGIKEIYNKTDKKKMLIEIECTDAPSKVLHILYSKTDLQKNYNANQWALISKTPKLFTLNDYITTYVKHNLECFVREAQFDLKKAQDRLHIVDGLLKALEDIDNIIALIKSSKSSSEAKVSLINKYNFTEIQAKAILDMKLAKLANLEKVELQEEAIELNKTIEELTLFINNEELQKEELSKRLDILIKKYGKDRKTELQNLEIPKEEKEIEAVIPEDVVVILTQSGLIKKISASSFKVQKRNGKGVKNEDGAILSSISTNTIDILMAFSSKGKMYRLLVDNVPTGTNVSRGTPINTLIKLEPNETIVAITSLYRKSEAKNVVFITKQGMIKKTLLEEYKSAKKNTGIAAIKIKEGDELVNVTFLNEEELVVVTKEGMAIRFETKNIAPIGRIAMGVKSIKLSENDEVIKGLPIHKDTDCIAVFTKKGIGKKVSLDEFPTQGRCGKGLAIYKPTISTGKLVGAEMISDEDNILLIAQRTGICISAKEVPLLSRTGIGNIMIKNAEVTSVVKL